MIHHCSKNAKTSESQKVLRANSDHSKSYRWKSWKAALNCRYFKGRNFQEQKLSRVKKNSKFLAKKFAFGNFWNKFCGKTFANSKQGSFSREKTFANSQNLRTNLFVKSRLRSYRNQKRYKIKFNIRKFNLLHLPIQSRCRRHFLESCFDITLRVLQLWHQKLLRVG